MSHFKEWCRQASTLALVEARRRVLGRGVLGVAVLVGSALLFAFSRMVFMPTEYRADAAQTVADWAMFFQHYMLLFVVFFGCAGIFTNLFRGEMLDRSLHYTLLLPIRREVVVVGKYLGGLAASVAVLGSTTLVSVVLFHLAHGTATASRQLLSGAGLAAVAAYVGVTALACVGYGSLFLLFGLLFRNPMVPAVLFLGWEYLVPVLPPLLKVVSVTHHLSSLVPVPVPHGPFSILAEPTPPLLAVIGLLLVSAGFLALAAWRARKLEISYATD